MDPGGLSLAMVVLVLIIGSGSVLIMSGLATGSGGSTESEAYDPSLEYAIVGAFVSLDNPPVELDADTASAGPWQGPGPIIVERSGTMNADASREWTDLRLEVWPGPPGGLNGPALDVTAAEPVATAPMAIDGRHVSGELRFAPLPDRQSYYVTVTGLDASGERWQLSWPGVEFWQWRGTLLDLLAARAG